MVRIQHNFIFSRVSEVRNSNITATKPDNLDERRYTSFWRAIQTHHKASPLCADAEAGREPQAARTSLQERRAPQSWIYLYNGGQPEEYVE